MSEQEPAKLYKVYRSERSNQWEYAEMTPEDLAMSAGTLPGYGWIDDNIAALKMRNQLNKIDAGPVLPKRLKMVHDPGFMPTMTPEEKQARDAAHARWILEHPALHAFYEAGKTIEDAVEVLLQRAQQQDQRTMVSFCTTCHIFHTEEEGHVNPIS